MVQASNDLRARWAAGLSGALRDPDHWRGLGYGLLFGLVLFGDAIQWWLS